MPNSVSGILKEPACVCTQSYLFVAPWFVARLCIKNPTFYCWCAFPVFPFLSSHTLFQDSPLMMDLFTERPVNRAITTTSPSATACQRSHPSGIKSCVVSFLFSFLLSLSPRVISVHRDISHGDSFSCQMDLWTP